MQSQVSRCTRIPFGSRSFCFAVVAGVCAAGAWMGERLGAQAQTVPGFSAKSVTLPKPTKGWAGFAVLPDGRLVAFEGKSLVQLDPTTGKVVKTLASLTSPAWGSAVLVGPSGKFVYFGESSTGGIYVYSLAQKSLRKASTIGFNYAFAFNPLEGERFLYVSAKPRSGALTDVIRLDLATGLQDRIVEVKGFSGPLGFDEKGNLYLAPAPSKFGAKAAGRFLRYTPLQVLSAIGPRTLTEKEAVLFAKGYDNALSMVRDGQGTFYLADASSKTSNLFEIGRAGGSSGARNVYKPNGLTVSSLAFAKGGQPFERFGREGSKLYIHLTNFFSKYELVTLEPLRPRLVVSPSTTPAPDTKLQYRVQGATGAKVAVWLLGTGYSPERTYAPLGVRGLRFPSFGISLFQPFLTVLGGVDAAGKTSLNLKAPSQKGVLWTTQVLLGPVKGLPGGEQPSPWVTSNPLTVRVK